MEAVEVFGTFGDTFDLCFMDIEMPRLNGHEATVRIRKMEASKNMTPIPIIGLSGNAREEHMKTAIKSGMDFYIVKPYQRVCKNISRN
jgi:CheY-like chemotaxis protein